MSKCENLNLLLKVHFVQVVHMVNKPEVNFQYLEDKEQISC